MPEVRWALSMVVVEDGRVTTAAVRDRVAPIVANYFAPFAGPRPILPWALVQLIGPLQPAAGTRLLPDLAMDSPLVVLPRPQRQEVRQLLVDHLDGYRAPDGNGATIVRGPFAVSVLTDATPMRAVLARVFAHLAHSDYRPRPGVPEVHNTIHVDDFATDTAGSWTPWSSSSWTHDAVNGERAIPWGNSGGPKGFRYSAGNAGSLDHEAQVSMRLTAPFRTRSGLACVRMQAAQRDGYVLDVHTRFPAMDLNRVVNGVIANLANYFSEPAGYLLDSEEWLTLRLAATGAVGANVLLHIWARTETSTAKPADPGWVGVDATPMWTYTDTAANRLDDATHTDCGIANTVNGGSSVADAKVDYFKLRALSDRGGTVPDTTLAGAASGAGQAAGGLTTAVRLVAAAAGLATATAVLATAISLAGAAAGGLSASGLLLTAGTLSGQAAGSAAATGVLATQVTLAGQAAGVSSCTAAVSTAIHLAGQAAGSAAATGAIVTATTGELAGQAAGLSTASGDLATAIILRGAAMGAASASGDLTATPTRPVERGIRWPAYMENVSLVELIETQAITWLREDARLIELIGGRVYTTIPVHVIYPYVLIEAFVVSPWNRLRGFGRNVIFTARAMSQVHGDYEVHRIGDRITGVIEGRDVPLPPAKRSLWSVDESPGATYTDAEAGVLTYHRPTVIRVRVAV